MTSRVAVRAISAARNFLFDLDGCIWYGDDLAPGAQAIVRDLRERGVRVGFLTNASVGDAAHLANKLAELGIPAEEGDVIAPLTVLAQHPLFETRRRALVLAVPAVERELMRHDIEVVADAGSADIVVIGKDPDLTYDSLARAVHALDQGAALLALNLDPAVPGSGGRRWPGVGAIAAALTTASGVEAELIGKPNPMFFRFALERFGMEPGQTVMVGDRSDTDIRGGRAAGLATVLIGTLQASLPESDTPDMHVETLEELRRLIG